ncbi:uncharacterized protein cubi_03328 [Cryptosporidium ubiquitum]|uniref:Uncharacterized protein n=1 Tax=Cryptosporidium ubiquitum TaxID=857276 RepID=A0A1J4MED1_9CRYT|nr:uncharacterized protein cubi_03328 [Cryptosporidium ubiquitum]OII72592.1 hypothetical protein cubi_03328 [Cryptosporidium ubiquitum]
MKYHSENGQIKESKGDEGVKIVKHSTEFNVDLPNLETTDSIDRHSSDSNLAQSNNITPTRCSRTKEIKNIEYTGSLGKDIKNADQGDISNTFISNPSSLVNSVERTTAPSSMMSSISRYDSCYTSNLSPSTNFQTPCGRNPKRRNTSTLCFDEYLQNNENDKSNNLNHSGIKKELLGSTNSTEISRVSNNETQSNQISGSVLLSAVLQVIASIQKLKNGEPNGTNRSKVLTNTANTKNTTAAVNNLVLNNGMANNNVIAAAQILGSKLPGVHPTTAALALAYSLSVAASAKKTSGGVSNSDDFIQNLNQIISERISCNNHSGNTENTDNMKITNELLQVIVSSLNSVVSHSQGEVGINIQKKDSDYLMSPNKTNELNNNFKLSRLGGETKASGSSYNLNLPPMDFIINEKPMYNDSRKVTNYPNIAGNSFPNKTMLHEVVNNNINIINTNYKLPHLDIGSGLGIGMGPGIEESFSRIEYGGEVCQASETNSSKSIVNESTQITTKSNYLVHENNNPLSLMLSEISKCSEKKIILESSNNYIWNDILYNQVFDHVDFETPFSRKHAYLRNELLFYNKPILEIDHGGDSFSTPNYIRIPNHQHHSNNKVTTYSHNYNVTNPSFFGNSKPHFPLPSKYSSNNSDLYNFHKYNPRIQSFCDDLLVNSANRKNSQIFNSINYLMQIVGDGNINGKMNGNNSN